jgi:hypothetical protein
MAELRANPKTKRLGGPPTYERDLVVLAVEGDEGVEAAADAARTPLLHIVAQEHDLALVRVQHHAHLRAGARAGSRAGARQRAPGAAGGGAVAEATWRGS